jgi:hypothetical protein
MIRSNAVFRDLLQLTINRVGEVSIAFNLDRIEAWLGYASGAKRLARLPGPKSTGNTNFIPSRGLLETKEGIQHQICYSLGNTRAEVNLWR